MPLTAMLHSVRGIFLHFVSGWRPQARKRVSAHLPPSRRVDHSRAGNQVLQDLPSYRGRPAHLTPRRGANQSVDGTTIRAFGSTSQAPFALDWPAISCAPLVTAAHL